VTGTAKAASQGYAPKTLIQPYERKKEKANPLIEVYERCYESITYRQTAPGLGMIGKFLEMADHFQTQTLIDYGCGTGRAGRKLSKAGLNVTMIDFAQNCLDEKVKEATKDNDSLRFILHDLTKPLIPDVLEAASHFGFCCDFMEHIPEEDVDAVLDIILSTSKHVFFQIACVPDNHGTRPEIAGEEDRVDLHCCVHNYLWWQKKFVERGCLIHRSTDSGRYCTFYVTTWGGIDLDAVEGYVNVPEEKLKENLRHNATLGYPTVRPFECQDTEVMFLCGGPSLNDYTEEIIQNRKDGMKLITANGTYGWALDHGLKPSLQFLIDAREFNKRFTQQHELSDETKFVIASATDPSVFETLPIDRTWLIHTSLSAELMAVIEEEFGALYQGTFPIPGGCTVALRALCALRMLGYYKIHIYGFDSCIRDDIHHAYDQEENKKDLDEAVTITVAPGSAYEKKFKAAPWMIFQALDFKKMALDLLGDVNLNIKGSGLIAYMVELGAKINTEVSLEVDEDLPPPANRLYVQNPDQEL